MRGETSEVWLEVGASKMCHVFLKVELRAGFF